MSEGGWSMWAGGYPLADESLVLLFHVHTHAHTHTRVYIYIYTHTCTLMVRTYARTHTQQVTPLQHPSVSTFTLICSDRVDTETFCFFLDWFTCCMSILLHCLPKWAGPAGLCVWGQRVTGPSTGFSYGVLLMGMPVFVAPLVGIRGSSRPTHTEVVFCFDVIDCKDSSMHTVEFYLIGSSCLFFST